MTENTTAATSRIESDGAEAVNPLSDGDRQDRDTLRSDYVIFSDGVRIMDVSFSSIY